MQDPGAAQKLSKDTERHIAKLRREFREHFDATVVAHSQAPTREIPMPVWGGHSSPPPSVFGHSCPIALV